jgi:hypothetical protein
MVKPRVTHHLQCAGCGRPITVVEQPLDFWTAYLAPPEKFWSCPHRCGAPRPAIDGVIVAIYPDHVNA